jgi:integrase
VDPIRSKKHIHNIKKILADKPRDLCLFTLGINTAFRANELLAIKVEQVRYLEVGDILTIKQRKTQKYRSVALNENVVESVKAYLRQKTLADDANLFTGLRGCLTVPTVNRLVKTWCASVGLKGNYGSHSMRKTWGYWQRQNGADILNLVEAFGHATQRQTMAYLGLQPEDVMKLYDLNL